MSSNGWPTAAQSHPSPDALLESIPVFAASPPQSKLQYLDALIAACGAPELNFLAHRLDSVLKLDFLARMPVEIRENIISYLDSEAVSACSQVCQRWKGIVSTSCAASVVLLRGMGVDRSLLARVTAFESIAQLFRDVSCSVSSLKHNKVQRNVIEGHSDRVCALYYKDGLLASAGTDSTVRITDVEKMRFERLLPCNDTTAVKFDHLSVITANFNGDLCLQDLHSSDDTPAETRWFRGHTATANCFDYSRPHDLLVSGSADWKIIVWRLSTSDVIKVYSSHSSAVTEIQLEVVKGGARSFAAEGDLVMYSKDKNICQVWLMKAPYNACIVQKALRSVDGHTFKHGLVVNSSCLVLTTRLRVHVWSKDSLLITHTVSCEHLSIPDLVAWGSQFGMLVDVFGLHVVDALTGHVIYTLHVPTLRKLDRDWTRFISGDVGWLDGFSGNDFSRLLYASATTNSYNVEALSWYPKNSHR